MHNLSDEFDIELWRRASEGDAQAEETLVSENARLVRSCVRPYFLIGGERDDLIQEGMLGLLSAVRSFSPENGTHFQVYAEKCIRRRILDAIKKSNRYKNSPLNEYVSFTSPEFDESQLTVSVSTDPESIVINDEQNDELKAQIKDSLSKFENKVFDLYLEGMSYSEMADNLGVSLKSVDNAVQRIRNKVERQITNRRLQ